MCLDRNQVADIFNHTRDAVSDAKTKRKPGDKKMQTSTTIKIENGNNEVLSRGISKNSDGTYTALTFSQSKTFKTMKGAQNWLAAKSAKK